MISSVAISPSVVHQSFSLPTVCNFTWPRTMETAQACSGSVASGIVISLSSANSLSIKRKNVERKKKKGRKEDFQGLEYCGSERFESS